MLARTLARFWRPRRGASARALLSIPLRRSNAAGASRSRLRAAPQLIFSLLPGLLLFAVLLVAACGSSAGAALVDRTHGGRWIAAQSHATPTTTPNGSAPTIDPTAGLLTRLANRQIAQMSLDDELGQLFIADFIGADYPANDAGMVERYGAGGIILYSRSLLSADQARAMIAAAQAHARIPLLVSVDQEGGGVDRLRGIFPPRPSARTMATSGSVAYVHQQGVGTGNDMLSLGLNLDLAPDVDVQLVAGPDLGSRNFGTDPQTATTYAGAFLSGLQSTGAVGCLKHFPGLGAASIDAHLGLPVINRTRAQIESVELAPYRNLIATGQVQCVMSTDLLMPALDPTLPAELSPTIIDGVLRGELGFDGVVMTDALYMDGIGARYSMPEAGVLAILAGCDMLEGPWTPDQMGAMAQALKDALTSGRLTKARIDQSVRRILILKMRMGLIPVPPPSGDPGDASQLS
jgi:beta-N-acetylhexosaminidase